jgi:hypothetical protein
VKEIKIVKKAIIKIRKKGEYFRCMSVTLQL